MPALLLLGFLICKHESPETQAAEFWHLINPKLEETIHRSRAIEVLLQLCYIAVDLPLKFVNLQIQGYSLKEHGANSEIGPRDLVLKKAYINKNPHYIDNEVEENKSNGKEDEESLDSVEAMNNNPYYHLQH